MNQILSYVLNMLPYILISLPIIILIRVAFVKKLEYNNIKSNKYREIAFTLFLLFLVCIASNTIFPRLEFGANGLNIAKVQKSINIVPFKTFINTYSNIMSGNFSVIFTNLLGSIIIFIPIGFFMPLLFKKMRSNKNIFIVSFLISFSIEIIQLFVFRISNIDDIILNVFGAFLGYFIFKILKKQKPKFVKKFRLKYYLKDRKNAGNRINFN